jgi:ascorbate-specific PTS system EIIC-type component UlaA
MVFNATFNNISVILRHQFYWWRILLFLYNVLPNVLVRHITHINTILLTLHIYDITSIVLLNSLAKNHRKSKNMNNL